MTFFQFSFKFKEGVLMKRLIILFSLIFIACDGASDRPYPNGPKNTPPEIPQYSYSQDPVLYVNSFLDEATARGAILDIPASNLTVLIVNDLNVGNLGPRIAGTCSKTGSGPLATAEVKLDQSLWVSQNDPRFREQLIFHELGHCLLNKSDNNGNLYNDILVDVVNSSNVITNQGSGTLMAEKVINLNWYTRNYEKYLAELFEDISFSELSSSSPDVFPYEQYRL